MNSMNGMNCGGDPQRLKVTEIDLQKNNGIMWLISRLKVGERYIIKLNSGG